MFSKKILMAMLVAFTGMLAFAADNAEKPPRYSTATFPGFDLADENIHPARKETRWFHFLNGPSRDTPAEQLSYAMMCQADGSWRSARRGYDALIREWPGSPEAAKAQLALAGLYLGHYLEYDVAFREYRYMLDFYSAQCDYEAVALRMFQLAKMMREESKSVFFFRVSSPTQVRRAFESLVLRAPGARFVPEALLIIGSLREEEGHNEIAIKVYENLRSQYPGSREAIRALHFESRARINLLRKCGYNRDRCRDTINFYRLILSANPEFRGREEVVQWRDEAVELLENEAFKAAVFYDSKTRTKRSAINALEVFLKDYPASVHADEARARLADLKSGMSQSEEGE